MSAIFYVYFSYKFCSYSFKYSLFTKIIPYLFFFFVLAFITDNSAVHELVFNSNSVINAIYR